MSGEYFDPDELGFPTTGDFDDSMLELVLLSTTQGDDPERFRQEVLKLGFLPWGFHVVLIEDTTPKH